MNFILYITICIIIFLCSLIGGRKYRNTTLYALAIGGVVNANFFHAGNYPIECFNLPFGIDSIIYTLFIFCVIVMSIKENKKSAYLLAVSSIVAILFSALMQLTAELLSNGSSIEVWTTFISFLMSSFASMVSIIITLEILDKLKSKLNSYILLIIGIIIICLIDTFIYYPLLMLIYAVPANILTLLFTSMLGKLIALLCSILAYYLLNTYDNKHKN